ncbi:MAG TPA: D-aminoacylase [Chryseosolibacter sp.]|nr:D-aminoacylase [Chryseosolibacter sp.]
MRLLLVITLVAVVAVTLTFSFKKKQPIRFDTILRNGTIYDGSGNDGYVGDIAINADTIATIGDLSNAIANIDIDITGLVVAPGFINMLSWAENTLLEDGTSMSDIKQGVTLEVFGEGWSAGPVRRLSKKQADTLWTSLGGYFDYIQRKGVSCNVASFVGATTVRIHEMDYDNRKPTSTELAAMKRLVENAMLDGAMGLGSSLGYTPASFASTEELIELCKVVSKYDGMYITHLRSEGDFIEEAIDEALTIASQANIRTEIYHLKVNIERNWSKIDRVLSIIDSAQRAGLKISANMYPYTASGTGLSSRLPAWVQEGGAREMRKRLRNPSLRKRVLYEMENGIPYQNSDPSKVRLMGFRLDSLNRLYRGKYLDEAARLHGKSADETVIDLIVRDKSRIEALYFLQTEENVRKIIQQPYVSFGSDAGSYNLADTANLPDHPRTYGTFARVIGKYVRDEKLVPLAESIRRLTSLPAANLRLERRGFLLPGYFADVTVFNYNDIKDLSTFEKPHQYSTGTIHVFVNGIQVLRDGNHTGARPGRVIFGPGYKGKASRHYSLDKPRK